MHELDVAGDITAAKEIRVALVPIGNISERKFVQFANLIKTFSVIELGLAPTPRDKGLPPPNIFIRFILYFYAIFKVT
jgi:hypothetical protein